MLGLDGHEERGRLDMNGLLVVFAILATATIYLIVRLIVFWNASRAGKDGKDR